MQAKYIEIPLDPPNPSCVKLLTRVPWTTTPPPAAPLVVFSPSVDLPCCLLGRRCEWLMGRLRQLDWWPWPSTAPKPRGVAEPGKLCLMVLCRCLSCASPGRQWPVPSDWIHGARHCSIASSPAIDHTIQHCFKSTAQGPLNRQLHVGSSVMSLRTSMCYTTIQSVFLRDQMNNRI